VPRNDMGPPLPGPSTASQLQPRNPWEIVVEQDTLAPTPMSCGREPEGAQPLPIPPMAGDGSGGGQHKE
jgi:hypothetical protein